MNLGYLREKKVNEKWMGWCQLFLWSNLDKYILCGKSVIGQIFSRHVLLFQSYIFKISSMMFQLPAPTRALLLT